MENLNIKLLYKKLQFMQINKNLRSKFRLPITVDHGLKSNAT
jgi:hypothetical protein